jgi:hypothetical protein
VGSSPAPGAVVYLGGVAQWPERLVVSQRVAGSSPVASAGSVRVWPEGVGKAPRGFPNAHGCAAGPA